MIKLLAIGLWVCAVSLGSSYVMAKMQTGSGNENGEAADYFDGLDYRQTNAITVPMISDEAIKGYIVARFVYTIDGRTASALSVPPDPFVVDAAFQRIYSTDGFDFDAPERFDIEGLTAAVRDEVNARFGQDLVDEVLVEQFDYIPKDSIGREPASG